MKNKIKLLQIFNSHLYHLLSSIKLNVINFSLSMHLKVCSEFYYRECLRAVKRQNCVKCLLSLQKKTKLCEGKELVEINSKVTQNKSTLSFGCVLYCTQFILLLFIQTLQLQSTEDPASVSGHPIYPIN